MNIRLNVVLCVGLATGLAQGAAIYSTTVGSTFAIGTGSVATGPSGLSSSTTGAGVADGSGVVSPGGVLPASKTIGVTGVAPFAVSAAASTYISGHLISIDNTLGLTSFTAAFTFDYFWSVTLSAGPAPAEFASGGGFFHITGIDNEILTIAGVPVAEYLAHHTYTTAMGGTGGSGGALVTGSIIVPAGVFSVFSVITDTDGLAVVVPEPGAAAMFGLGAVVCGLLRRRSVLASLRLGGK